jgi:pimeloyl-ACP methyl ester carboxylesterase
MSAEDMTSVRRPLLMSHEAPATWVTHLEHQWRSLAWRPWLDALVGTCWGGPIAIEYAVRHPERMSRLVLYGTYPPTLEHPQQSDPATSFRGIPENAHQPLVTARGDQR